MNTMITCDANEQQLAAAHQLLRPLRFDRKTNRSAQSTFNIMKSDFEHMLYYDRVNVMDISPSRTPCVRIVVTLPFQLKQAVKDTHHGPLFP